MMHFVESNQMTEGTLRRIWLLGNLADTGQIVDYELDDREARPERERGTIQQSMSPRLLAGE